MKTLLLSVMLFTSLSAFAQDPTNDPRYFPEKKVDKGLVEKTAQQLNDACKSSYEKALRKNKVSADIISSRTRDVCFCVAKDVKRRQDVEEMSLLIKSYKGQIAADAKLKEDANILLHELDKTEANCRANPKYRFGMPEPRLQKDQGSQE